MGSWNGHKAKFVRRFADVKAERTIGVQKFAEAVKTGIFPDKESESYAMEAAEWTRFIEKEESTGGER